MLSNKKIILLSPKTRLQRQGKKKSLFFFPVFVVAESAKPCCGWTAAQLPSSSCSFRDRNVADDKRKSFFTVPILPFHKHVSHGGEIVGFFFFFQDQRLIYQCEAFADQWDKGFPGLSITTSSLVVL